MAFMQDDCRAFWNGEKHKADVEFIEGIIFAGDYVIRVQACGFGRASNGTTRKGCPSS